MLLAVAIGLVLILPQVDLDDGVLKDVQNQVVILASMSPPAFLGLLLPPDLLRRSHEITLHEEVPLNSGACAGAILRC